MHPCGISPMCMHICCVMGFSGSMHELWRQHCLSIRVWHAWAGARGDTARRGPDQRGGPATGRPAPEPAACAALRRRRRQRRPAACCTCGGRHSRRRRRRCAGGGILLVNNVRDASMRASRKWPAQLSEQNLPDAVTSQTLATAARCQGSLPQCHAAHVCVPQPAQHAVLFCCRRWTMCRRSPLRRACAARGRVPAASRAAR
jgi:hypothetical protein